MRTTTSRRTKRTTKTTNGSKVRLLGLILVLLTAKGSAAKDKNKAKAAGQAFAVVAGTVYRDPGFALEGVAVTVTPESNEQGGVKFKKEQAATNHRGEFAVRVPPVPMNYRVDVKLNGYQPQSQAVQIEGEQRKELSFVLEPQK